MPPGGAYVPPHVENGRVVPGAMRPPDAMAEPSGSTAPWLAAPESRGGCCAALAADGRPARFVGGCVRDALLDPGADAADLDIATPERPERVMALLAAAGHPGRSRPACATAP